MEHDGSGGRKMTDDEAAQAVAETIAYAAKYPIGQPVPLVVTLTDEQWVAVKAVLQVGLIIQNTDDMHYMPDDMAERAHQAWHDMFDQIKTALLFLAENERKGNPLGKEGPS